MTCKRPTSLIKNVMSVDVEEWFHILDLPATPKLHEWASLEKRVEKNFRKLLETFAARDVKATCFFLGWIAERYPHLVREATAQGHEIASHGYSHQLVYRMTRAEFAADLQRSRKLLEDISGNAVLGYRAPGFSNTKETPWFFDVIAEAGHKYDSSVFPGTHGHGGVPGADRFPHVVHTKAGNLAEFPVTTADVLGKQVCFFGGGYLRLFPSFLIKQMSRRVQAEGRPVVYYVHPREIDPSHPRLPMNWKRRFKCYVGLSSTQPKLKSLLEDFSFTTFSELLPQVLPEAQLLPEPEEAYALTE